MGGGVHVRDPSMLQPPPSSFLFFRKWCVGAYVPPGSSLLPEQQKETTAVPTWCVFLPLRLLFLSMKAKKEKTEAELWVNVCLCVCVCVWLYGSVYADPSNMWPYGVKKNKPGNVFCPAVALLQRHQLSYNDVILGTWKHTHILTKPDPLSVFLYYVRKNEHWDPVLCGSTWITSRGQRAHNQNTFFHTQIVEYRHNEDCVTQSKEE